MKKEKGVSAVLFSGILAGELAVLLDTVSVFCGRALSVPKFGAMLLVLFLVILLPSFVTQRFRKTAAAVIAAAVGLPLLVAALCWHSVSESVVYNSVDEGKAQLYANRKVMLLIPHQDDDINVLGGVMEEYVKYGSEVYVVFSTNGDYYGLAETRFQESLDALGNIGIPGDHVIFLGYGDQWDPDGPHLYNGEPGEILTSVFGRTETYSTAAHGVYREGNAYTIDNFLADIESVILEHRPDVLYCVDYDYNIDHRALSMSFEKVMGKILKENGDYRPLVFKGYAYNTAWEAEKDFYGENLLSAQNVFAEPYNQMPGVYRWEERVRLPVSGEALSRSVLSAEMNTTLSMYASQGANMYGPRIFNSDKVFWQRFTTSLCMEAELQASSGSPEALNDFMLLESHDLLETGDMPYDGAWSPEAGDQKREVQVTFAEPRDLAQIVLYDHPDPEKNVLNAVVTFDDGTVLETGPLDAGGAATPIGVEKTGVASFKVVLEQIQGAAGLTEIEAFGQIPDSGLTYIKLMDGDGNFAYDYWIDRSGVQTFQLYERGMKEGEEYTLSCSNSLCSAVWEDGGVRVTCPEGESCVVSVTSADGNLSDSIFVQNPGSLERAWKLFWLRAEEAVMNLCDTKRLHERIFVCRLLTKASGFLDGILN